jgi:hypothetical protein
MPDRLKASERLYRRYVQDNPEMEALMNEARQELRAEDAAASLASAVATEVLGWHVHNRNSALWYDAEGAVTMRVSQWRPEERIEQAWRVVECLRGRGWRMTLSCNDFIAEPWDCRLFLEEQGKRAIAHGVTAPDAICRAALAAVRGER